jgi:hypothetical protein
MSSAKITQTRYFNRYGNKKVALLEEGQSIEIDSVYGFDEYHFEDIYLCRVVNPSDACKNHGGYEDMLVKVHSEYLESEQ